MKTLAVSSATKHKVKRIAQRNRWTLAVTVDAIADAYLSATSPSPSVGVGSPDSAGNQNHTPQNPDVQKNIR